jgi:hypothetical protein
MSAIMRSFRGSGRSRRPIFGQATELGQPEQGAVSRLGALSRFAVSGREGAEVAPAATTAEVEATPTGVGGLLARTMRKQATAREAATEAGRRARVQGIESRLQERFRAIMARRGGAAATRTPLLLGGAGGGR